MGIIIYKLDLYINVWYFTLQTIFFFKENNPCIRGREHVTLVGAGLKQSEQQVN